MKADRSVALLVVLALSGLAAKAAGGNEEGAKGLFIMQMDHPGEALNTGVQYWIELHREQQVLHVNNKTAFHSGDMIRFHVKPNISGFAYILLKSGSRGEQSVLFPDPSRKDDNRVAAGQEFTLPADGFLAFDQNPGTEKVTLLVSRATIDATAYLSQPEAERTLIASAATGSKDLIPTKIVLAYAPSPVIPVPRVETVRSVVDVKAAGKPKRSSRTAKVRRVSHAAHPAASTQHGESGTVTVVRKDPSGVLAVDVALQHD